MSVRVWIVSVALLAGCGLPSQSMITPTVFRQALITVSRQDHTLVRREFAGFEAIKKQCRGRLSDGLGELPAELADCALMGKLVDCVDACLYGDETTVVLDASSDDYEEFVGVTTKTITAVVDQDEAGIAGIDSGSDFTDRWTYYLSRYVKGEFYDRTGGNLGKPQLSAAGVENDTIVGLMTVTLEAIYDHSFRLPVLFSEQEAFTPEFIPVEGEPDLYRQVFRKGSVTDYHTKENHQPTAAKFDGKLKRLVAMGEKGITRNELQAIHFVSNLSGEQSKALSGLVIRFFGDVEVGFVVGGHFSVGDNDTLAKLAETVVEVSARRATEAAAYRFFEGYTGNASRRTEQAIRNLLEVSQTR